MPPEAVAEPHVHVPAALTNDPFGAAIVVPSGDTLVDPVTVTVAVALAVPFDPVQARLYVVVLVSPPVDALPETALAPDHPPEAVHDVALVEDQVSVDPPPLVTDVGFAVIDAVGPDGGGGDVVGAATTFQLLPDHRYHIDCLV